MFKQTIFTSSMGGVSSRYGGFQFWSYTEGIKEDLLREIETGYTSYVIPRHLPTNPSEEEISKLFPKRYRYSILEFNGTFYKVLTSTRYLGKEVSTQRYGNYVSHTLVKDGALNNSPADYFFAQSLFRKDFLKSEVDGSLLPRFLGTIEDSFNISYHVSDLPKFLNDQGKHIVFAYLLQSVYESLATKKKIIFVDNSNIISWIRVITSVFPKKIVDQITFDTYCTNYESSDDMILGVLGADVGENFVSFNEEEYFIFHMKRGYYPKDLLKGAFVSHFFNNNTLDFKKIERFKRAGAKLSRELVDNQMGNIFKVLDLEDKKVEIKNELDFLDYLLVACSLKDNGAINFLYEQLIAISTDDISFLFSLNEKIVKDQYASIVEFLRESIYTRILKGDQRLMSLLFDNDFTNLFSFLDFRRKHEEKIVIEINKYNLDLLNEYKTIILKTANLGRKEELHNLVFVLIDRYLELFKTAENEKQEEVIGQLNEDFGHFDGAKDYILSQTLELSYCNKVLSEQMQNQFLKSLTNRLYINEFIKCSQMGTGSSIMNYFDFLERVESRPFAVQKLIEAFSDNKEIVDNYSYYIIHSFDSYNFDSEEAKNHHFKVIYNELSDRNYLGEIVASYLNTVDLFSVDQKLGLDLLSIYSKNIEGVSFDDCDIKEHNLALMYDSLYLKELYLRNKPIIFENNRSYLKLLVQNILLKKELFSNQALLKYYTSHLKDQFIFELMIELKKQIKIDLSVVEALIAVIVNNDELTEETINKAMIDIFYNLNIPEGKLKKIIKSIDADLSKILFIPQL